MRRHQTVNAVCSAFACCTSARYTDSRRFLVPCCDSRPELYRQARPCPGKWQRSLEESCTLEWTRESDSRWYSSHQIPQCIRRTKGTQSRFLFLGNGCLWWGLSSFWSCLFPVRGPSTGDCWVFGSEIVVYQTEMEATRFSPDHEKVSIIVGVEMGLVVRG